MEKNFKLLILETEEKPKDRKLDFTIQRTKALNAISSSGAKVCHDSGGRLIVVEMPQKAEKLLVKRLPTAQITPLDSGVRKSIADLDSNESLFLEALKIRTSVKHRDAKKRRRIGQTPEEKMLISAPDVREEY